MAAMTDSLHTSAAGVAGARPPPDPAISEALISAHRRAVEVMRSVDGLLVGWTVANQNFHAADGAEEVTAAWAHPREDLFLEAARGDDFIGVQAYTRVRIGPDGPLPIPDGAEVTRTGWEYWPDALEEAIWHTWEVTGGMPILVTENGVATDDDQRRIVYTSHALHGLRAARRRHRHKRVHPLERAGQLRVGRRVPADVRPHRGRPHDLRADGQTERTLARRHRQGQPAPRMTTPKRRLPGTGSPRECLDSALWRGSI